MLLLVLLWIIDVILEVKKDEVKKEAYSMCELKLNSHHRVSSNVTERHNILRPVPSQQSKQLH